MTCRHLGLILAALAILAWPCGAAGATAPMDDTIDAYKYSGVYDRPATLEWIADDCGCPPVQSDKKDLGKNPVTYGFYPIDLAVEVDETQRLKTAKIKFDRFSRIGYYALVSNDQGGFPHLVDWEQTPFKKTTRRHNSRLDLVVALDQGATDFLMMASKHRALARSITGLIRDFGGDGVTVDFRHVPQGHFQGFLAFVTFLKAELEQVDPDLFLNLFCDFNAAGNQMGRMTLDQAAGLQDRVDLFLVLVQAATPAHTLESFLTMSIIVNRHNLQQNNLFRKNRILPVFSGKTPHIETYFRHILDRDYGGIGFWPDYGLDDEETRFISSIFRAYPMEMDTVEKIFNTLCPGCCKIICPNRLILVILTCGLGLFLLAFYILSRFICRLRTWAHSHTKLLIAAILIFWLLFAALATCIPFWQGLRTEVIVCLLILSILCLIRLFYVKHKPQRKP